MSKSREEKQEQRREALSEFGVNAEKKN